MTSLTVTIGDTTTTCEPDRPWIIGRTADADIVVAGESVSRRHLELRPSEDGWTVVDLSSNGSYVDGTRIEAAPVGDGLQVSLGGADGPVVRLDPVQPARVPDLAPPAQAVPAPATIGIDDLTLRLEVDGRPYTFLPGTEVVVGRDETCDVVVDDTLVSRRHCVFTHDGTTWVVRDTESTRGTWIDGQRITAPAKVEGTFQISLGGSSGGVDVRVTTAGEHVPERAKRPTVALSVVALVAVLALGASLVLRSPSGANTPAQLAAAKEATVMVLTSTGTGSGAFVSDDLILTNAHVVEDGADHLIAVSPSEDARVELAYVAEVEAYHPFLDLALLRVTEDIDGNAIGDTPTPLPIGDSSPIGVGSDIAVLGFPAVTSQLAISGDDLLLPTVTASQGSVVTFQEWFGCDAPGSELGFYGDGSCSPDGTLDRGNMVTDSLSSQGGSGGPIVVDGELVAVLYAGIDAPFIESVGGTQGTASTMPSEYFADWVEEYL